MNTQPRRVLLALSAVIGLYVGLWAAFFPDEFYRSFPGFGRHWVSVDGAFNEHLIRDVGGMYLGLGLGSVVAMYSVSDAPGRAIGAAWALFGVVHFGYHSTHLVGDGVDKLGTLVALGLSLAFGLVLALPARVRTEVAR